MQHRAVRSHRPRPDRRARRTEGTRRKLMQVGLELFAKKPAHAVAIEQITEAADLGKGTFYNYFTSREDLLNALMGESFDLLLTEIRLRVPGRPSFRIVDRALMAILDAHVEFFNREPDRFIIYLSGILTSLREAPSEAIDARLLCYLQEIEHILRPFLPREAPTQKLRTAACTIAGFTYGYLSMASIGLDAPQIIMAQRPIKRRLIRALKEYLWEADARPPDQGQDADPRR